MTEDPDRPEPAPIPSEPPSGPTYLPMAAYAMAPPPPPAPTWTRAYEIPTARKVVAAGLQLAVESNAAIRRASIYVGLLALGAFGPAVLLLLLGIARLLNDPATADVMASDPTLVLLDHPEIVEPLLLIYVLLLAGAILLIAISIDAQAMAIAILGGRASDKPVRLWESVVRARQVFWRLLGTGLLVVVMSTIVRLVVTLPFIRLGDSNTGLTFIGSMVGSLVVTPFAFVSAGIVLGDVGVTEALRRSMALFRARPRISLVVTLFTLVTSAIQTFAISAGADAAVRVGEVMHLSLDQGAVPLVITTVIVLAFIVAFGSLTFTIAAIVAAPQVAGFLGLTYYSGGLDKARSADDGRPRRFRWVSVPMIVAMVSLALLAGFGLPTITGARIHPSSPMLSIIRAAALEHGSTAFGSGVTNMREDPTLDVIGSQRDSIDLVSGSYAYLREVPAWLLPDLFNCSALNVACGDRSGGTGMFVDGAYLFHQRMSGPPGIADPAEAGEWGPMVELEGSFTQSGAGNPFNGASHVYATRIVEAGATFHLFVFYPTYTDDVHTSARSTWIGNDLLTIVPVDELESDPVTWDAFGEILYSRQNGSDTLRATTMSPLFPTSFIPYQILFVDSFAP